MAVKDPDFVQRMAAAKALKKQGQLSKPVKPQKEDFSQYISKRRRASFTLHNIDAEMPYHFFDIMSNWEQVRYLIYALEICPETGKLHVQGYIEFIAGVRISTWYKKLNRKFFNENSERNSKINIRYCKKGGQSKEEYNSLHEQGPNYGCIDPRLPPACICDGVSYKEIGEPSTQGKKKQNRDVIEDIRAGSSVVELLCEGVQPRFIESVLSYVEPPRSSDSSLEVIWAYGDNAKAYIHSLPESNGAYVASSISNFEGYDGDSTVLLDLDRDGRAAVSGYRLSEFVKPFPFRLPVKCKQGRQARFTKLFISSSWSPVSKASSPSGDKNMYNMLRNNNVTFIDSASSLTKLFRKITH